jgi:hypothetical protein
VGVRGAGKIEAMKWYDFRVDTQYMGGGNVTIYLNGQMLGQGKSGGGGPGRFDGGIYWYHGSKQTRNIWFSNISIGEK